MKQFGICFPRNSVLIPRPTNIYLFGSHRKIPLSFSRKEEEFLKKNAAKKNTKNILIGPLHRIKIIRHYI